MADLEYAIFPEDNMGEYLLSRELQVGTGFIIDGKGYVLYRDQDLRDILRLGVVAEHRGQGLGEKLLMSALCEVTEAMLTVRKTNTAALRLYAKHGFRIVGDVPRYRNWVMAL